MNKKEKKLVEMLNKALADEWLSYYRYWIGAKIVQGKMSESVSIELEELATEELRHADMLVKKIVQLKSTPVLNPADWNKVADCGCEHPEDNSPKTILFQNIKSEQCTIDKYKKVLEFAKEVDPAVHEVLNNIIDSEIEQKDTLVNILEHFESDQE